MRCRLELNDTGEWRCVFCGRLFPRPTIATCRLGVVDVSHCPLDDIIRLLTPAGVDRLQRCREAECKLMLPVEGSIRCVGMPGSKCQWIAEWATRLNDEAWVCPHWKEITPACTSRQ